MDFNIAVVDDQRLDSEKLTRGIHKWFTDNCDTPRTVTCFPDGEALLRVWEPEKFQIVFMDIIMNRLNGIQTAQILRASDAKALLVFTTSSREYSFDAFPLHAFDYIIKPCNPDKLAQVLSEAVRVLDTPEPVLMARVSKSVYKIRLRDISAVMSRDHFVEVVLEDGRCILCSMSFKEAEAGLEGDQRFLECNRGVIINMDCVASVSKGKDTFLMNDGSQYAIRCRGRMQIYDTFTQYQIARMHGRAGQ